MPHAALFLASIDVHALACPFEGVLRLLAQPRLGNLATPFVTLGACLGLPLLISSLIIGAQFPCAGLLALKLYGRVSSVSCAFVYLLGLRSAAVGPALPLEFIGIPWFLGWVGALDSVPEVAMTH